MDPQYSAQEVLRCHLCEIPIPLYNCENCYINLCKTCAGEHLLDETKEHRVLSIKQRSTPNYPKCSQHATKICELHCDQCDIPICVHCVSSGEHLGHRAVDILKNFERVKEKLKNDLQELEESIYPKYQEIASNILLQKAALGENTQKLSAEISKRGEDWHREVENIIMKLKSDVDQIESEQLTRLNKEKDKIKRTIFELAQSILDLRKLLNSNDVCLISEYKSENDQFKQFPPKLKVSLQKLYFQRINTNELLQQFGFLSHVTTDNYILGSSRQKSYYADRPTMDVPQILTAIDTGYPSLSSVACLNDEAIWTHGKSKIMKLYNLHGKLLKSIQTKSSVNVSSGIAVTKSGYLFYTDDVNRTVNVFTYKQMVEVIRLVGWTPRNVCVSSSDSLLVIMNSDDYQTRVVRYYGSKEGQIIQLNQQGSPLYSSGNLKYISENRNLDICVADWEAGSVVVVDQAGKLRFTYTGLSSTAKKLSYFHPVGITTDSQGRILTIANCCIHIIDEEGMFLRLIDNCDLCNPYDLCVDSKDNLFVAENRTGKVKKIQYFV